MQIWEEENNWTEQTDTEADTFVECFKLLVSQKKNVCVCVGRWVGACMHACVCVYIVIVQYFLVFERFLAPCFIELLIFYC